MRRFTIVLGRTPLEIANLSKNLLLRLEPSLWLCVLSSSDRLITPINRCQTHHQPSSFTHSLTNLLYWTYWAHILFHLGLCYNLWPYSYYSSFYTFTQQILQYFHKTSIFSCGWLQSHILLFYFNLYEINISIIVKFVISV